MEKDSFNFFCGSLALAPLLGPALPHLVATFRQDSGLAYSKYGAAFTLFASIVRNLYFPSANILV